MLTVGFRFIAGRYHATPWNRQVNEGTVEWPPHPWRIVRSLIATYHMKGRDAGDEKTLLSIIEKISAPPVYQLPDACMGHTRHYMPLYKEGKSSKIFDTFATISRDDVLLVSWPDTKLDEYEKKFLSSLLRRMSYLGRAESWVEADISMEPIKPNCYPLDSRELEHADKNMEITEILLPMGEDEYISWLHGYLEKSDPKTKRRLTALKSKKDALCIETSQLKKDGWSQPPCGKWVQYLRPSDCFDMKRIYSGGKITEKRPTVARYAVASQVPPRLTEAIYISERVHMSLVKYSDSSPVFTGRQEDGQPLSGHEHTHILCESNPSHGIGRRGEITHISLFSPMGFGMRERKALDMLKKVWGHGGHDIRLILVGTGNPEEFGGTDTYSGRSPVMGESNVWLSRTPFVPTRHPKTTRRGVAKKDDTGLQIGSPEHELIRLLVKNGFPRPESTTRIEGTDLAGHWTRWLHFRRERKKGGGTKATNMGYGFRIEFSEPIRGPIALGYGAHFGLGLFVPEAGPESENAESDAIGT